ncbi:AraC family transcriptional regulator [Azoarcus olearius]|uniref:AraC-family transcriptional regulator n=1 Tax=Azoarcus sp. (strain BH72) TaxID=418699 RepID=A1K6X6_AZOSB|nr:AraC family transcriptional regulator [Azoarcus olearius]ANQ85156.1 AraC family transcriptional regulator [Azoarcus olearius]CAL94581.1 putative AraC-family transcriptional regulator [Azoarcus olearius]
MDKGMQLSGPAPATYCSRDVDETRRIVAGIYCDHRLEQLRGSECLDYHHVHQRVGAVSFSQMRYGADVMVAPGSLQSFFLIQVPLSGRDRMRIDGAELDSDPRHATVHAPHSGLTMNWSGDCTKFVVRIERDALERHASALAGRDVSRTIAFCNRVDLQDPMARSWVSTAQHLFGELRSNPALADQPLVSNHIEQLLLTTALNWLPGSFANATSGGARLVLPRHVRRAEELMRGCPEQPITMESLAAHVGVSARTLYDGFRNFLGVSPMRYLRDLRMERARADLLDPAQPASVTTIATHWGFFQLGRFAADYRRRYGEHPRETMARRA